jgi:hypothetical protein
VLGGCGSAAMLPDVQAASHVQPRLQWFHHPTQGLASVSCRCWSHFGIPACLLYNVQVLVGDLRGQPLADSADTPQSLRVVLPRQPSVKQQPSHDIYGAPETQRINFRLFMSDPTFLDRDAEAVSHRGVDTVPAHHRRRYCTSPSSSPGKNMLS